VRTKFYVHRKPEELYDVADLDSLDDLSERPGSESILAAFRAQLLSWMTDVDDPLREQFSRIAGS
jgi:hypothetical protein